MSEHVHDWKLDNSGVVIDTFPEQHPYFCDCGAFTHDPETGKPCPTCAPEDYALRAFKRVTLRGGPFNGAVIAEPSNREITLRVDDSGRAQMCVSYERSEEDSQVYVFRWNLWTLPFVPLQTGHRNREKDL